MEERIRIGKTIIEKEEYEKVIEDVISVLKKEKRTYLVNKSILKDAIERLEEEIID